MANNKKLNGTIIQRKDGTFTVRIQDGVKSNGKPYRKERRARSLEEAELKLKELRKEIKEEKRRKTLGFKDYTTEEYVNLFLKYKKRSIKTTSYERIVSTAKTHIIPYIGMTKFCQIKGEQIQNLLDVMYENKLSHSSIKKVYDFFNACYKWAINKQKDLTQEENPMLEVDMISSKKFSKKKIRSFSNEEVLKFKKEALRTYSNGKYVHKLGPAFILMLNTGIREGELCAINKKEDIQNAQLTINSTAITIRNQNEDSLWNKKWTTVIQDSTKTYSGSRILPLNQTAQEMIKILEKNYSDVPESQLLVYNKIGNPFPPANMVKPFKDICRNAGIENIKGHGPHVLRHTFATELFNKGFEIKVVSELLGHRDVFITQDVYIDVIKRKKIEAIKLIEI